MPHKRKQKQNKDAHRTASGMLTQCSRTLGWQLNKTALVHKLHARDDASSLNSDATGSIVSERRSGSGNAFTCAKEVMASSATWENLVGLDLAASDKPLVVPEVSPKADVRPPASV